MSNKLLLQNLKHLLSCDAKAVELQYAHRDLDDNIEQAERNGTCSPEDIKEAKGEKLIIKDHMSSRGIATLPRERKRKRRRKAA